MFSYSSQWILGGTYSNPALFPILSCLDCRVPLIQDMCLPEVDKADIRKVFVLHITMEN